MILIAVSLFVLIATIPLNVSADFYQYRDEGGTINLTNDFKSIPQKYRANVKVITENELENRARKNEKNNRAEKGRAQDSKNQSQTVQYETLSQNVTPASTSTSATIKQETASIVSDSWSSKYWPLLKLIGIALLLIAGFVIAGKLVSSFAPRSLAIVIRVALFAAIIVYLFKNHSEKFTDTFVKIKGETGVAQKAADYRNEKIQQQSQ